MPKISSPELIVVRESPIHGMGVYAARKIKKGTRIIEYKGERISSDEADRRYDDDAMETHHTFLFYIDEDTCIDAANNGNEARFINHSCEPNCIAYMERKRVFIYALKTIGEGDELTYDYSYTREGDYQDEWKKLYACRCGSPKCRGTILQIEEPLAKTATRRRESTRDKRGKSSAARR
jgi:SET domain-containing protein